MSQRNDERTYQQKAALATARKEADEAYKDFVAMLNAAALMDESERTYEELFNQINELINYNRLYVVPKKGSSKSEDEEDGGDDSEDEGGPDGASVEPNSSSDETPGSGSTSFGGDE